MIDETNPALPQQEEPAGKPFMSMDELKEKVWQAWLRNDRNMRLDIDRLRPAPIAPLLEQESPKPEKTNFSAETWRKIAIDWEKVANQALTSLAAAKKEIEKLCELRGLDADAYVSLNDMFRRHVHDVVMREERMFMELGLNTREGRHFNERAELAESQLVAAQKDIEELKR